jgi:hypothetical protein
LGVTSSIQIIACYWLTPILQGDVLRVLIPRVLASTGQKFITLSLVLLTQFSKILPPGIVKLLNDKLVATLYEMIPRHPTDLTGEVINLPPHEQGLPNRPYARSVPVGNAVAPELPNLDQVFDRLLKRSETEDWNSVSLFFLASVHILNLIIECIA